MTFHYNPAGSLDHLLKSVKALAEAEKLAARILHEKVVRFNTILSQSPLTKEDFKDVIGQLVQELNDAQYDQKVSKLNFENLIYELYEIIGEQE